MSEINLSLTAIPTSLSRSQLRDIISLKDVAIGNLLSANKSLHEKILTLEHDKSVLESIIEKNNAKINELTEENRKLRERVGTLEDEVKQLIDAKKNDNSRLLLSKLVLAIQEVNKRDDLQGSGGLDYLEDLRVDRNQNSHYMFVNNRNRKYEKSIISYGKKQLLMKLNQAKTDGFITSKLEIYSPTLVDDIIKYLSLTDPYFSDLPQDEKRKMDMWWD
jgi:hypothetical protein